mmetsp:Transcript_18565/g.60734  ORF Transcript_18565/g.60734 Transcript_18565/m.60734 type:complete len:204 (-) Transcript_18565:592-1203(-)
MEWPAGAAAPPHAFSTLSTSLDASRPRLRSAAPLRPRRSATPRRSPPSADAHSPCARSKARWSEVPSSALLAAPAAAVLRPKGSSLASCAATRSAASRRQPSARAQSSARPKCGAVGSRLSRRPRGVRAVPAPSCARAPKPTSDATARSTATGSGGSKAPERASATSEQASSACRRNTAGSSGTRRISASGAAAMPRSASTLQ